MPNEIEISWHSDDKPSCLHIKAGGWSGILRFINVADSLANATKDDIIWAADKDTELLEVKTLRFCRMPKAKKQSLVFDEKLSVVNWSMNEDAWSVVADLCRGFKEGETNHYHYLSDGTDFEVEIEYAKGSSDTD